MTAQNNQQSSKELAFENIVEGPGKFELSTALFTWRPARPQVEFVTASGKTLLATITSVEAEDGSGNCWNITGGAYEKGATLKAWRKFRGFYRTGGPGGKVGRFYFSN